jgi:hypothetical protein
MHLADENRVVVTSLVLVDFPAGLESSLRLLLASRGTRQGQHYRLLVISSNQDRRQTALSYLGENPVPVPAQIAD